MTWQIALDARLSANLLTGTGPRPSTPVPHKLPARSARLVRLNAAIAVPAVKDKFVQLGVEPMPLTSDGFRRHIAVEAEKWGKVIKAQNIKITN